MLRHMQEVPDHPQPHSPGALRCLLLWLLPGLVFLLCYPFLYKSALLEARESFQPRWSPANEWGWILSSCAVKAAVPGGILALLVFMGVAFVFVPKSAGRCNAPGGCGLMDGILMFTVNLIVCSAGAAFISGGFHDLRAVPTVPRKAYAVNEGIWRASFANGDKPGVGLELQRGASDVTCAVYLLDPDAPHEFRQGRKRPVTITNSLPKVLEFTVRWSLRESESLRLHLPDGIGSDQFRGQLSGAGPEEKPEMLVFRRTEQRER